MQQLESKITQINKYLSDNLKGTVDLKGLSYPVVSGNLKSKKEAGTEIQVQLNSDSTITAYHIQDGEIDFSKYQNRGKGKLYFPVAPMALICMSKDRHMEEVVFNLIKDIPDVTIKTSGNDKYQIWNDEVGNKEPNSDLHLFKVRYDYHFKTTECLTDC